MLTTYNPAFASHQLAAEAWLARMKKDGDLDRMFLREHSGVLDFLAFFRASSTRLYYRADEDGMWLCAWTTPFVEGYRVLGLWVRADRRRKLDSLRAVEATYAELLREYPRYLGITKQLDLLRPHEKMGYRVLCEMPPTDDGPAWLVGITREWFAGRRSRHIEERERI